jgi:A/G-specific adenine glycosylase
MAVGFVGDLFSPWAIKAGNRSQLRYSAELGSVPWLFSHLKLTMHVQLFRVDDKTAQSLALEDSSGRRRRWASADSVEKETMGTGMRLCWALVKKVAATKSRRRSPSPYNE